MPNVADTPMAAKSVKLAVVIGAGVSGLTTVKALKEEGFYVVCYEKSEHLGGLWHYRDYNIDGLASVMKSTVSNVSKELMAFSDFPPPRNFPNFMPHNCVMKYLELYAESFDLKRHIRFKHEVLRVLPTADNYRTGRWEITVKDLNKGRTFVEVFDGVAVCVGRFGYPKIPTFNSMDAFRGKIIHVHDLKRCEDFKDLTILVVGSGNSGADAAVYLSDVADQVYLSSRNGTWVLQRPGSDGLPADLKACRRVLYSIFQKIPKALSYWFLEKQADRYINHSVYNLKPSHRILTKRPTVNDVLGSKILSGSVIIKGGIKHFTDSGVVFQGESEEIKFDVVIMATGYSLKVPFLGDMIFQVIGDYVPLYKHVFPPHLTIPSMAIIGMTQVFGGVPPVCEMQARWFAQVLKNNVPFPDKGDIINDITINSEKEMNILHPSARNCMMVHYISYLDELANLIGAKPDFNKMFLREPKLCWDCVFGPCLPYQYRLVGPHSWTGARHALQTYKDRVLEPFRTRHEPRQSIVLS